MARYAVERYRNEKMFSVHLDVKVPECGFLVKTDDNGRSFSEKLRGIGGVDDVSSRGYCVTITRGGVFTIDELVPKVLEVLKLELGIDSDLEEVKAYS